MYWDFSSVNILSEDPLNKLRLVTVKKEHHYLTQSPTAQRPYIGTSEFTHFNRNE
jgi:hypothetical protein